MGRFKFHFAAFVLLLVGCRPNDEKQFSLLDKEDTGINFQNTFFDDGPLNVANYIYFYNGGGVATGDINNDGLPDLLFTGNMVRNRLFLNKGNMKFEDITGQSHVADKQGWCTGATMADVNGDGKLDIYICRSADIRPELRKNLLFINNGNNSFTESAEKYGLADTGYSTQAAFFDYDKDGDLDCFIINHSIQKYTAGVQENPALRKEYSQAFACKLYQNNNGHFEDVSLSAGITSSVLTFGLGVAVSDLNNDGWPDVYVSNDFNEPDYLFMNNRDGTFTEQLSKSMDEVSLYSMGSDAADYNNDGYPDIYTLDMMPEDNTTIKMHSGPENYDKFQQLFSHGFYYQYSRNMLQQNNGDGTFSEVGQIEGVSNTDWSWTPLFADFDNDGYKDLFVTNGYVKDYTDMDFLKYSMDRLIKSMNKQAYDPIPEYIRKMPTNSIPNYIFKNDSSKGFIKKTAEWGFEKSGISAGAAFVDLDNDGDLDLVINNSNDFADVYRNNQDKKSPNNFLRVKFKGSAENSEGIGAKVTLYCGNDKYFQEQFPVRGFQSSSDPVLNFGLGSHTVIDSLVVIWPDDYSQKFQTLKSGSTITLDYHDATSLWRYDTLRQNLQTILKEEKFKGFSHRENSFSDFTVQTLLPNFISREGPAMASGDVNGDGLQDIFFGGAKGQPGALFLQEKGGAFVPKIEKAFLENAGSEDVASIFFDADGDGDLDLYCGEGGFEFKANDSAYQDKLFINDGKGNFIYDKNRLPGFANSTSCVHAADVDGDGDPDLFVGARVIPGKYPESASSYVLINDGKGNFTDQTNQVCPALTNIGLVTDAAWVDLDNNKLPELIVVGEWMPIKVFQNTSGKLADASQKYIKFNSAGWWNKVFVDDMDGDGDPDLVIGNYGLNTQFKVSEKEPMTLYYDDFDGNGTVDPIICYYIQDTSFPLNSRDDLAEQLPGIKKKFLEYRPYATATINDIFTPEQIEKSKKLHASFMRTVYLENKGTAGFELHSLPGEAQISPVYAIASGDFNRDGKKDLLLAGNNTWTRIKFGRYSANHGELLLGDGKGRFREVPQTESGLNIRGNSRNIVPVTIAGEPALIAGVNDDSAVVIRRSK